ncbi:MAG TPA: hypothetical protein VMF89_25855 [Polyangiales bacterium]|nr:hypothetical protein [Polyangiales bacterium]
MSSRSALLKSSLLGLGLFGLTLLPESVEAQAQPAKALRCAVELSPRGLSPKTICGQLGKAIGRGTQLVADARKGSKSDALQIIYDDVQWTLVLLRDGNVRSWTRVSAADARGREVEFFARAVRSLLKEEPKTPNTCIRLEPKTPRGFDLVYPWAELKPCEPRVIEVPDPWWTNA